MEVEIIRGGCIALSNRSSALQSSLNLDYRSDIIKRVTSKLTNSHFEQFALKRFMVKSGPKQGAILNIKL